MSETPFPPGHYFQVQPFHGSVLVQCVCCVLPATLLLLANSLPFAAIALFGALTPLLAAQWARRDPPMYSSVLVGTLPMVTILRGWIPGTYNLPEILAVSGALLWIAVRREGAQLLLHRRFTVVLMTVATLYWLASAVATGDYSSNMRAVELAFYALNIFLLGRHRAFLGSALLSLVFSAGCVAVVAFPRGDRLGMFEIDGKLVGSPQTFGSFATLLLVATFVDGGRWLGFVSRYVWLRSTIRVLAGAAVLLSTSRSAWIVSAAAIALIYLYDNRRRLALAGSVAALALGGIALIAGGAGATFERYLDKTFNLDQSLDKLTTGRSEQWAAMPAVIRDSPVWGFGPGSGRQVAAQYAGFDLAWHALYMQITAELGLAGLAVLLLLLLGLISRCLWYARKTGEILPLLGAVGFALIGFTVPALDAASGCFLGFGLISFDSSRWYVPRASPAAGPPIVPGSYAGRPSKWKQVDTLIRPVAD